MRRIIDKRKKEKYMLDDEYLNGMARLCGWQGTIVYNSLCRHADKNQKCFPSIKLICEQHGVGRNTVLKGIKILEYRKVIEVKKTRSKGGQWLNNEYILQDKSDWIYDQVPLKDMVHQVPVGTPPSPSQGPDQVPVEDTKETHKQGNTYKETHNATASVAKDIVDILEAFKIVNPSYRKYFGNKTQRASAERLLEEHGKDIILATIEYLPKSNAQKYAPTITTAWQMEENLGKLKAWSDKLKTKKVNVIL